MIGRNLGNVRRNGLTPGHEDEPSSPHRGPRPFPPRFAGHGFKQETQVGGVAAGSAELDVAGEQRIAVFLDKSIETFAAIFGAWASGAAFVPVNPLLRPAQVGHILRDRDVRVLVTSPERLALMRDELESRVHGWERLRGSDHEAPTPNVIDLDIAAILNTSGSTGRPKGEEGELVQCGPHDAIGDWNERYVLRSVSGRFPAAMSIGAQPNSRSGRATQWSSTPRPLYMVPSSVVVHDAIPRLPNGEFDRALSREESATWACVP
jgi:acyl-CoA synthetase (AMP-forming)/AMP-acid ligase II